MSGVLSVAEGLLTLFDPEYYQSGSLLGYLVLAPEGAALLVLLGALSDLQAAQSEKRRAEQLANRLSSPDTERFFRRENRPMYADWFLPIIDLSWT